MRCAKALGATPLFSRPHHQRIARLLEALNGPLLREHHCLFGGGTAIALKFGEYRESVAVDFLVSGIGNYRGLRTALTGVEGLGAITRQGTAPLEPASGLSQRPKSPMGPPCCATLNAQSTGCSLAPDGWSGVCRQ